MSTIEKFEDFMIWQKAIDIAVEIYKLSKRASLRREFGIRDQIIRSSLSIASNIAEGFEYNNGNQFIRFLKYAKGSGGELRSQLYFLQAVELISTDHYKELCEKLRSNSAQIKSLISYLEKKQS